MLAEEVTRSIYEFLVAYIHAVAYITEVYPANSFSLKNQYGMATYENNHPGVKTWVENAAKAIMQLIYSTSESHRQATISIVILEESIPIERFGITCAQYELQARTLSQSVHGGPQQHIFATDLSEKFRACFSRLYSSCKSSRSTSTRDKNRSMTVLFEGELDLPEFPKSWIVSESEVSKKEKVQPIRSIEIQDQETTVLVLNTFRQAA